VDDDGEQQTQDGDGAAHRRDDGQRHHVRRTLWTTTHVGGI